MVLSGEIPLGRCTNISTSLAVLSSTFRIFIFPFSLALRIESISEEVVVPKGISVMTKVALSLWAIRARTLIRPPRIPSL